MRPVVVDASALAAVVFSEPDADAVAKRLQGALLAAPSLLGFELANVAWKKARRADAADTTKLVNALLGGLQFAQRIAFHKVDHADVVLIARATGLSTYDASYVWLAGWLGAELVTLDQRLIAAVDAALAV